MEAMRDDSSAVEFFMERMAIREVDGGMSRYQAEAFARADTRRWCSRTGNAEPRLPESEREYMTLADLAESLDVSRFAVRLTVLDTGRLRAVCTVDGEPAFDREEALQFIEQAKALAEVSTSKPGH